MSRSIQELENNIHMRGGVKTPVNKLISKPPLSQQNSAKEKGFGESSKGSKQTKGQYVGVRSAQSWKDDSGHQNIPRNGGRGSGTRSSSRSRSRSKSKKAQNRTIGEYIPHFQTRQPRETMSRGRGGADTVSPPRKQNIRGYSRRNSRGRGREQEDLNISWETSAQILNKCRNIYERCSSADARRVREQSNNPDNLPNRRVKHKYK